MIVQFVCVKLGIVMGSLSGQYMSDVNLDLTLVEEKYTHELNFSALIIFICIGNRNWENCGIST